MKSKLLSIGIGTVFAFIVVMSSIWCISTYYDFKMHEAESSSVSIVSNTETNVHDERNNRQNISSSPNNSIHSECVISFPRTVHERYPLSNNSPEQLARDLFPPPPYSEVGKSTASNPSIHISDSR